MPGFGFLDDATSAIERRLAYLRLPSAAYRPSCHQHKRKNHTSPLKLVGPAHARRQQILLQKTPAIRRTIHLQNTPPTIQAGSSSLASFRTLVEENFRSRRLNQQLERVSRFRQEADNLAEQRAESLSQRMRKQQDLVNKLDAVLVRCEGIELDKIIEMGKSVHSASQRIEEMKEQLEKCFNGEECDFAAKSVILHSFSDDLLPNGRLLVESALCHLEKVRSCLSVPGGPAIAWDSTQVLDDLPIERHDEAQSIDELVAQTNELAWLIERSVQLLDVVENKLSEYRPQLRALSEQGEAMTEDQPALGKRRLVISEMNAEEERVVDDALGPGPANELLCELLNVPVYRRDMRKLKPGEWLNDEVVNYYFKMLLARANDEGDPNRPKCHVTNTQFYPKLAETDKGYCYANVRRWTKKVDIFSKDLVIIPIHCHGNHWTLALINFSRKRLEYFDPLFGSAGEVLRNLRKYVQDESKDKSQKPYDMSEWREIAHRDGMPRQQNGYDCGVFMCVTADYVSQGAILDFSQKDMPLFRRRMAFQMVRQSLDTEAVGAIAD